MPIQKAFLIHFAVPDPIDDNFIHKQHKPAAYIHKKDDLKKKPIQPENKMNNIKPKPGFFNETHPYKNHPSNEKSNTSPPL